MPELTSDFKLFKGVNVDALGDDVRCNILRAIKDKLGFTGACRALGIAKSSLHRYLSGERRIPDDAIRKTLEFLTKDRV